MSYKNRKALFCKVPNLVNILTLFRMVGGGRLKGHPTSFSPVTSANVELAPKTF